MGANSILESTKKNLGLEANYTAFDLDIVMFINGVFSTLNQLGIGPGNGFMIEDNTPTWDDFLGVDPRLNSAKNYTYLKVRLLFDPPGTSFLISAYEQQIKELEWRLAEFAAAKDIEIPEGFGVSPFGVSPFGI